MPAIAASSRSLKVASRKLAPESMKAHNKTIFLRANRELPHRD
jgi:hypothetical protein